jgi:hypothetical protein
MLNIIQGIFKVLDRLGKPQYDKSTVSSIDQYFVWLNYFKGHFHKKNTTEHLYVYVLFEPFDRFS